MTPMGAPMYPNYSSEYIQVAKCQLTSSNSAGLYWCNICKSHFFRHVLIGFSLIHDASDMFFLLNNPNQFIFIGVILGKVYLSLHVTLPIHCILPVMMIEFTRTRLSLQTRSPSAIQSVKMTIFFFFFFISFSRFFSPFFFFLSIQLDAGLHVLIYCQELRVLSQLSSFIQSYWQAE